MAQDWSAADVAAWLVRAGFGQDLADTFKENDIDGAILLDDLTENDMQTSLNIASLGKRRKLLRSIQHLRDTGCTSPPPSASQPSRDPSPSPLTARPKSAQHTSIHPQQPPITLRQTKSQSQTSSPAPAPWKFEHVDLQAVFATRSIGRRGQSSESDDHNNFSFSVAEASGGADRSNADRLKQRMMKRLFQKSHVIHADEDVTGKLKERGLEAIWIPPLPRHEKSAAVRIFQRTVRGIEERLDNSGTYGSFFADPAPPLRVAAVQQRVASNAKQPVLVGSGFEKRVVGGYSCKRKRAKTSQREAGNVVAAGDDMDSYVDDDDDDDPELPPFGESDMDDYYYDSEWEDELIEHDEDFRALHEEVGAGGDSKTPTTAHARKPEAPKALPGNQGEEDDLNNFSRSGKTWAQTRKSRKAYTGSSKRRRISSAAEVPPRLTRFLSADTVRAVIEDQIVIFKERWRKKMLPKYEAEAYKLFKQQRRSLQSLQDTRDDLQKRRLPALIDKIVSMKTSSEKEVRAQSASCETTIHHICELEWLIQLVQGPKPPRPPKPAKVEKKKKAPDGEKPPNPTKPAPQYEPDKWSDFIASEDDYAVEQASVDLSVQMQSSDTEPSADQAALAKARRQEGKRARRGLSPGRTTTLPTAKSSEELQPWLEGLPSPDKLSKQVHDEVDFTPPAPMDVMDAKDDEGGTNSDASGVFAAEQGHISSASATPRRRTSSNEEEWDFDSRETVLLEFQVTPDQRKIPTSPTKPRSGAPSPADTPKRKSASSRPKMAGPLASSPSQSQSNVIVINSDEDAIPLRPDLVGTIGPRTRRRSEKQEPKSEVSAHRRKLDAYFLQWSHEPIENLLHSIEVTKHWPLSGQPPPNPFLACLIQELNYFVLKTAPKPAENATFRQRVTVGYDEQRALLLRGYIQWRAEQTIGTDISEKDVIEEPPAIFDSGQKLARKAIKVRDNNYEDWSSDDDVKGRPATLKERLKPKTVMKARPTRVHVICTSSDESDRNDQAPASQDRRKRRDIQKIRPESQATLRKREARERQDEAIRARADKQANEKTSSLIVNLGHDKSEEHIFLAGFLERHLKPHQVEGLRFLWKNIIMVKQPGGSHAGCILAHAMGLGKTLQVIAFLYTLMTEISKNNPAIPEHIRPGRILIIAPVNVLLNWKAEFLKWIPVYHREPLREIAVLHSAATETRLNTIQRWHSRGGVLIAGYEAMVGLRKAYPAENKMCVEASLLICDEGHLIKNSVTQRTMALASMETPSRILLTGSPLQNHLTEYWCMINFACNDFLGSLSDFRNAFENPIKNGFCLDSTEGDKRLARSRMFILCKLIEPIVQRMDTAPLKAELPLKTEFIIVCKLTPLQQAAYKEVVSTMMGVLGTLPGVIRLCGHPGVFKEELDKKMDLHQGKLMEKHAANASAAPTDAGAAAAAVRIDVDATASVTSIDSEADASMTPPETENSPITLADAAAANNVPVFPIIEIDDSPEEPATPLTKNELEEELAILNKSRPGVDAIFKTVDDPFAEELSVKVKMALAIVTAARTMGEKVLVFSTSIPILHYLLSRFTAHKIASVLMEGATSQTKRQKMIHDFGADEATVFLISTRTGSVGINLQAATRVVVFDIGWNPTDAEQAIARAYRYGQTKPVTVYRLSTYGTFEETLYKINVHKSKLSKRVIDKINTSKDFTKTEMRDWCTIPADPEEIEWELNVEEEAQIALQDPILAHILSPAPDLENDRLTVNKYIDLAAIRRHDDKFAEIDNEMDESERAQSLLLYEEERNRRKSGLRIGVGILAMAATSETVQSPMDVDDVQPLILLPPDEMPTMPPPHMPSLMLPAGALPPTTPPRPVVISSSVPPRPVVSPAAPLRPVISPAAPPRPVIPPSLPVQHPNVPAAPPPAWIMKCQAELLQSYPSDRITVVAADPFRGTFNLLCLDCSGVLFPTGPSESFELFESHLNDPRHRKKVSARQDRQVSAQQQRRRSSGSHVPPLSPIKPPLPPHSPKPNSGNNRHKPLFNTSAPHRRTSL
ncbi:hypothetical protein HDU87_006201 [Geranomyces variabilis]|uniref:Uncharacterized protein n=1 Tax=Geranomyces variabilis TaxID=109894 RepID=A0AAD5TI79_9FUNG|nr:hypothetical protein HDU87_006201 [Geranomyces variabilis]